MTSALARPEDPAATPALTPDVASPPPAFDAVYAEMFPIVWRALRRFGVPADQVEDAAQEVFLVVHRRLPEFEGRSALRTWIFGITHRVAAGWNKRARRRPTEPISQSIPAAERGPADEAARSEAMRVLLQLLGELDEPKRAVFVLAELEQLAIDEIAAALETNVNTVRSRLAVARREFDLALRRHHARDAWRQP